MKLMSLSLLILSLAIFSPASPGARAADSPATPAQVEVVQSVPLETTLEVPGIRLTQAVWLEMIAGATRTIDLEEFYINNQAGETLQPVLDALKSAAARGVKVRLIVDQGFDKTYPEVPSELSQTPGFEVKTIDFSQNGGIMHAKYFVVDGKVAYVGSANFDWLALSHIHEVGLKITDAGIGAGLESVFAMDWQTGTALSATSDGLMDRVASRLHFFQPFTRPAPNPAATSDTGALTLLASPTGDHPSDSTDSFPQVATLIDGAQVSVTIQVYEYTTTLYKQSGHWDGLDSAIRRAAARGVKVQLMTDAVSLKAGKKDLEGLARVNGIEVKTVQIPEWSGGHLDYARLIHSKYMVIDHQNYWVGTENWSKDYFYSSRNVGVVQASAAISSQLEQIFNQVWTSDYTSAP